MTTQLDSIRDHSLALGELTDFCRELGVSIDDKIAEALQELDRLPSTIARDRARHVLAAAAVLLRLQGRVCADLEEVGTAIETAENDFRREVSPPVRVAMRAEAA